MRRSLLALALIVTAGTSYAQTLSTDDPNNRPMIGRNDWVRQPGDQPGPASGGGAAAIVSTNDTVSYIGSSAQLATAPPAQATYPSRFAPTKRSLLSRDHATGPEPMPSDMGPKQVAFTDEYGFRYDADGNRLDRRGMVISPHTTTR